MRRLIYPALLVMILSFSGCFQILHYIGLNDDGSIDVYWQFDISRSLAEKDAEKNKRENKEAKKDSIMDRIEKTRNEFPDKLKKLVTDLEVKKIEDEYQVGVSISFKAKKYLELPKENQFNLLPEYNKSKNCLVFNFEPEKRDENGNGKSGKAQKKDEKAKTTDAGDQGMQKLLDSIFSSARYQVVLGGKYEPEKAEIKGRSSGKKIPVSIVKIGSQSLIVIPFMSISMAEEKGFDLYVFLK